jgi:Ca2+-binding RTX toxin-like protein
MPSHRTGLGLFSIALAAACAAPAAASAATVGTAAGGGNSTVTYTAVLGVDNDLTLDPVGATNNFAFTDAAGTIVANPLCVAQGGTVVCPRPFATALRAVEIDLRNGDDRADLRSPANTITRIKLGNGADRLTADTADGVFAQGEAGDDVMTGGDPLNPNDFTDTLEGGFGNDVINGRGGKDTLEGGPNRDTLTGGSGRDIINGGLNADTIFAEDGEQDTIDCGSGLFDGTDVAHVDEGLDVTRGCERQL